MEAWVSVNRLQRYMNLGSICWTRYYTTSDLTGSLDTTVLLLECKVSKLTGQECSKDNILTCRLFQEHGKVPVQDLAQLLEVSMELPISVLCWSDVD